MASVIKVDTIKSTTGNTALTISESGVPQLNVPAFRAYLSSDQSVTSGANAKVQIDSVTGTNFFDTDGWFDTANNRYVPQTAGYYLINGTIRIAAASAITRWLASIYKTGAAYEQGNAVNNTSTTAPQGAVVSTLVYLNGSTDYVELYGQITATTPRYDYSTDSATALLSGFLVRAA